MVDVQVFDDVIDLEQRKEIWNYIEHQTWHAFWKGVIWDGTSYDFVPAEEQEWRRIDPVRMMPTMYMIRAAFASDEASLKERHPVIYNLWEKINGFLGNEYTIEGPPEGIVAETTGQPHWQAPPTQDPSLAQGWRVYANGQPSETFKRSHGIHRDTVDLTDDTSYTLLYMANLEWYPSWMGENVFYPDDPEGLSGDHQQFQSISISNQKRNFNIGWADDGGKMVSPKPGRIILYNGRTLHTTKPTAIWANAPRKAIAFRIRKKSI